jgi:Translation initiation factor IF-2, N-terminal region
VNGDEFTPLPEKTPETQSALSGGLPDPPPRPPKLTARDLLDPGGEDKTIFVAGYIEVRELGQAMKLKPFKVVADLMELRIFKHSDEMIDFETAAKIAQKHGFHVKGFM